MTDHKDSGKKTPSHEKIRREVDAFYEKVSTGVHTVTVPAQAIEASLGYDEKLLGELPEEIRLGLSCGNPLEHLFLEPGETLLDLGSGTGVDVFLSRLKFPESGMIYGLDRLPQMIERAEKARAKKGFKNIEFRLGTLTEMPFPDASIDKVISNCVINLEPDKKKVYEEIHRVLKPGGMFFISDITLKKPLSEGILSRDNLYGS